MDENTQNPPAPTSAPTPAPTPAPAPALPQRVVLAAPYGFYDDDGAPHFWSAGQVVEDAEQVKALVERGAPLEA